MQRILPRMCLFLMTAAEVICWPTDLIIDNGPIEPLLNKIASELKVPVGDKQVADYLDSCDPFSSTTRKLFEIPKKSNVMNKTHDPSKSIRESTAVSSLDNSINGKSSDEDCLYFCGNSLGLMPRQTKDILNQELQVWSSR
jgi:kynureninase